MSCKFNFKCVVTFIKIVDSLLLSKSSSVWRKPLKYAIRRKRADEWRRARACACIKSFKNKVEIDVKSIRPYFNRFLHTEEEFYTRKVCDFLNNYWHFLIFILYHSTCLFILKCHASPTKIFTIWKLSYSLIRGYFTWLILENQKLRKKLAVLCYISCS